MPAVPVAVTDRTIAIGRFAIVATVIAWSVFVTVLIVQEFVQGRAFTRQFGTEAVVYVGLMTLLTGSALAYLTARLGFFYRAREHWRVPRAELERALAANAPSLTVLVPSYQEEERVIRMTLLSAALQEYPDLKVVLLIDDKPDVRYTQPRALLAAARALPEEINGLLAEPAARFREARAALASTGAEGADTGIEEMHALADLHDEAVAWLRALAGAHPQVDHSDDFFRDHIVGRLAADLALTAGALRSACAAGAPLPAARLDQLHARLASIFTAEVSSFERKQFVSLSHEANKAMNLNSYIGLMGRRFHDVDPHRPRSRRGRGRRHRLRRQRLRPHPRRRQRAPARVLRAHRLPDGAERASARRRRPDPVQLLSGLGDTARAHRRRHHRHPAHRPPGHDLLRRHLLGRRQRGAAQAGARRDRHRPAQGDWEIRRYVQDRTVIEDTESSIDLRIHGWRCSTTRSG